MTTAEANESANGFDRLRPRGDGSLGRLGIDAEGKQALFSSDSSGAALGGVTVECGHCGQQSSLAGRQALGSLLSSVHVPRVRSPYRSWMRCPSCGRRTWVEVRLGR